jgi:hypothetical protein
MAPLLSNSLDDSDDFKANHALALAIIHEAPKWRDEVPDPIYCRKRDIEREYQKRIHMSKKEG